MLKRVRDIEARADREITPLQLAVNCWRQCLDGAMIKLLLDRGVDKASADMHGWTPGARAKGQFGFLDEGFDAIVNNGAVMVQLVTLIPPTGTEVRQAQTSGLESLMDTLEAAGPALHDVNASRLAGSRSSWPSDRGAMLFDDGGAPAGGSHNRDGPWHDSRVEDAVRSTACKTVRSPSPSPSCR
ncbi:hypothetical protein [Amycolatopsis rubida]|uniref:Uncharacterized protein n=1 Tax=Amycolatopsis rubida TaxID=112413 RepID=A0A1I5E5G3_9PSEU|nr:hypothetical protein [Amycolatopsis rubida]SFO06785.1 hypothetical protein SAMN05421854_101509 [Amycolatopsis rubida]